MFVDEVLIEVKGGDGGNGAVAFRREKFVPNGGPNGGDGGAGGDVILEADSNLSTLLDFQYQRRYEAPSGDNGTGRDMHGLNAKDLILKVPIGTVATDTTTGRVVADLTKHGVKAVVAQGGVGGRGNARFTSSTHQTPKFSENGEPGMLLSLKLELKLLADVGIIGFPNVGKSTLIAAVSAARPKIANYPFTTLVPNLGVVRVDHARTLVMADIPGLIEGASEGIGLGHQFLRHIERTRILVHVLDVSGTSGRDPLEDYATINKELAAYSKELSELPQIIALNKVDIGDPDMTALIREELEKEGKPIFVISAATHEGTQELVYACATMLLEIPRYVTPVDDEIVRITVDTMAQRRRDRRWDVVWSDEEGMFVVSGPGIERFVYMTNMDNEAAVTRLQRTLNRAGIVKKLRALNAKEGDTVRIGTIEFDYIDEDFEDEKGSGKEDDSDTEAELDEDE